MTMPEAAVNEDDTLARTENDVRISREIAVMQSESIPQPIQ
jgi:hypothetical protein